MSFPRYAEYTDSGVEWLGPVPPHWRVAPLKSVANVINGYPFDSKLFDPSGPHPLVRIRDLNQTTTDSRYAGDFVDAAAVDSTDVLIGMDGDFNVGRWLGEGRALLNQRMCCVRSTDPMITRFLEYALPFPLQAINDVTYSTTVKHLSSFDVLKIRLALPGSTQELGRVVAFLDRETAKIDALVEEQKRLIELLKEKRQAVISQAVTKGLDPNVPMKDSGVEWLGKVPAHWQASRLANLFSDTDERGNDNLPVLTVSIHDGVSDDELDQADMDRKVVRSDDKTKYKRVQPGDLVYNMMRAWQGGFGSVTVDGMVSPAYVVARPRTAMPTEFVENVLRTPNAIEEMRGRSRGVTDFRLRLYWEEFKEIVVPIPPSGEVAAILAHIRQLSTRTSNTIAAAEECIAILQERRSALISAAVTGKIDVRGLGHRPHGDEPSSRHDESHDLQCDRSNAGAQHVAHHRQ